MPFDKSLPEWNNAGTEPPQSLKDSGWAANQKPPADYFNWFFNIVYLALQELQQEAVNDDQKGVANGVATLGSDSKLPLAQMIEGSTTTKGVLQLTDSVASTSTTTAATPNSVKTANDAAAQAQTTASNKYSKPVGGIPKADLEVAVQTSLGKADSALQSVPAASTTVAGVVQLNDNINSTSTTQAGTANAVKKAYDLANVKYTKPAGGIPKTDLESAVQTSLGKADTALQSVPAASTATAGIVQLNDTTTSTSTTQAATANAVKTAYDKAVSAETNAKTYADQKVSALVNSSPTTLDTLDELAQALGDDPNFATTMTNLIGSKETPSGAQAKADAAESGANAHSDQQLTTHKADDVNHVPYAVASGTNALVVTLNPVPTAYADGMAIAFKNSTQNTGAVTINVNSLGAKPIVKSNGNAFSSGNLKAGSIYTVRYNATTGNFILQGEGGAEGNVTPDKVLTGTNYTDPTSGNLTDGTMPNNGAGGTVTPSTSNQTKAAGYYSSAITISGDPDLVSANIKSGANIFGIAGSAKEAPGDLTPGTTTYPFINAYTGASVSSTDHDYREDNNGYLIKYYGNNTNKTINKQVTNKAGTVVSDTVIYTCTNYPLNVSASMSNGISFQDGVFKLIDQNGNLLTSCPASGYLIGVVYYNGAYFFVSLSSDNSTLYVRDTSGTYYLTASSLTASYDRTSIRCLASGFAVLTLYAGSNNYDGLAYLYYKGTTWNGPYALTARDVLALLGNLGERL